MKSNLRPAYLSGLFASAVLALAVSSGAVADVAANTLTSAASPEYKFTIAHEVCSKDSKAFTVNMYYNLALSPTAQKEQAQIKAAFKAETDIVLDKIYGDTNFQDLLDSPANSFYNRIDEFAADYKASINKNVIEKYESVQKINGIIMIGQVFATPAQSCTKPSHP